MFKPAPIVLTISELLGISVKRNDITSETALQLKNQYEDSQKGRRDLSALLFEFAKDHIHFMMLQTYDDLDKKGLLPELKEKYLFGFTQIYYLRFGVGYGSNEKKSSALKTDGELLLQFAVDNGIVNEDLEYNLKYAYSQKKDSELLYQSVLKSIKQFIDRFEEENYDQIKNLGKLDKLKEIYYTCFIQKYLEKFGFEYKQSV